MSECKYRNDLIITNNKLKFTLEKQEIMCDILYKNIVTDVSFMLKEVKYKSKVTLATLIICSFNTLLAVTLAIIKGYLNYHLYSIVLVIISGIMFYFDVKRIKNLEKSLSDLRKARRVELVDKI